MDYDLIIKHGTIVDGTGAPRYEADLAIADGKIAAIGQVSGRRARSSTRLAWSSRPASSIRIVITTPRSAGIRC